MPEAEQDSAGHEAEVTHATPAADPSRRLRPGWIAGLAVALVVVVSLTAVLILNSDGASSTQVVGGNPTSVAVGDASGVSRTGSSPAGDATASPGTVGASSPVSEKDVTSGPGGWAGHAIAASASPDAIMAHLTERWQLRFAPPNHRNDGGTTQLGRAGDLSEKNRHILAELGVDSEHRLRFLECDGGGRDVHLASDTDMRRFVEDCLAQGVPAADSAPLTAWVDKNYATGEHLGPSELTYKSASFFVTLREYGSYIETDVNGR